MGIFDKIDFNNLPKNYNEQDVREDIITPWLKALGYSTSDESNRIIREPKLEHPFTQFGTKSSKSKIIPDYLIKVNNKNAFIVEAKSPLEDIRSGKNVAQAYSYAINREVQVNRYVLCNGKELNIFEVNKIEPVLSFQLGKATFSNWNDAYELLSPMAFINLHIFNFKPDYGIWCLRNGIMGDEKQFFYNCYITDVARLEDNLFTFIAVIKKDEELMASFDFDISLFESFMEQVPDKLKDTVRNSIRKSPFRYQAKSKSESFPLNFVAYLTNEVINNKNEEYLPLRVKEFLKK